MWLALEPLHRLGIRPDAMKISPHTVFNRMIWFNRMIGFTRITLLAAGMKLLAAGIAWGLVCSLALAAPAPSSGSKDLSHASTASITTSHGFALHGDLKYPEGFSHFDFVNPKAPKGGSLKLLGFGTFDSLNPYTLKGTSPFNTPGQFIYGFSELNESLLAGTGSYLPSGDEPQSAYGLIAESLSYPDNIAWVTFTLRSNARFHDGHRIDAHDVVFSFNTLMRDGHPRFQQSYLNIAKVEALDDKTVKFYFKTPNQRASILRAGELPVLPKHFWQDRDFSASIQTPPLLSGPYKIHSADIGKRITLARVPDFWAHSLNIYQGRFNFDTVSIDYYRDQTVAFEAFKAGQFDLYYEYTAKNWAKAYDFPAIASGEVKKRSIAHAIPAGTQGLFFNTRKAMFASAEVRQAISMMFDFEWTNAQLFNNAYQRNTTYYPNSEFSANGLPSDAELQLLKPLKSALPHDLFESPPPRFKTSGNGKIRKQMRTALTLLKRQGWSLKDHRLVHDDTGEPFEFELAIRQPGFKRVLLPFAKNLEKIGIKASVRLVDATQFKVILDNFDFDMTSFVLPQGNAPSFEQRDYYHSSTANQVGSRNYAGIQNIAVDALLEHVVSAVDRPSLVTAMRALDRVLLWQHYIVPNWHINHHRLAHWDKFANPKHQAPYTLGTENWWIAH